jgi:hypothetical protein
MLIISTLAVVVQTGAHAWAGAPVRRKAGSQKKKRERVRERIADGRDEIKKGNCGLRTKPLQYKIHKRLGSPGRTVHGAAAPEGRGRGSC